MFCPKPTLNLFLPHINPLHVDPLLISAKRKQIRAYFHKINFISNLAGNFPSHLAYCLSLLCLSFLQLNRQLLILTSLGICEHQCLATNLGMMPRWKATWKDSCNLDGPPLGKPSPQATAKPHTSGSCLSTEALFHSVYLHACVSGVLPLETKEYSKMTSEGTQGRQFIFSYDPCLLNDLNLKRKRKGEKGKKYRR